MCAQTHPQTRQEACRTRSCLCTRRGAAYAHGHSQSVPHLSLSLSLPPPTLTLTHMHTHTPRLPSQPHAPTKHRLKASPGHRHASCRLPAAPQLSCYRPSAKKKNMNKREAETSRTIIELPCCQGINPTVCPWSPGSPTEAQKGARISPESQRTWGIHSNPTCPHSRALSVSVSTSLPLRGGHETNTCLASAAPGLRGGAQGLGTPGW